MVTRYDAAYIGLSPLALPWLAWRWARRGKYRRSAPGMMGRALPAGDEANRFTGGSVWIHAVTETTEVAEGESLDETVSADVESGDPWANAESLEDEAATADADAIIARVAAVPATTLLDVGIKETEAGVLVHLRSDGQIESTESFTLENPDRLVVDLPGLKSDVAQKRIELGNAQVATVRIGSHPDKVRVVIDGGVASNGFSGRRVIPASDGIYLTLGTGADLDDALAMSLSYAAATTQAAADSGVPELAAGVVDPDRSDSQGVNQMGEV